jgi:hypothetical protein
MISFVVLAISPTLRMIQRHTKDEADLKGSHRDALPTINFVERTVIAREP